MTGIEAVVALKEGKKIYHISWEQKEYIRLGEDGQIYNEENRVENFGLSDLASGYNGDEWGIWRD